MAPSMVKYEELRRQRVEENKRRMEELCLPLLSQALKTAHSPKPSPMKKAKPRAARTELVQVRRSLRSTKTAAPVYKEVTYYERVLPRRASCPRRDILHRVYASDEGRAAAVEKAEKLEASLESEYPSFVRPMLPSHVSGGFWLGLPAYFCRRNLPARDETVTLVDEAGEVWPTVYLSRKTGLSGGWKKFAVDHDLVDGDALVFQLIQRAILKVYITRVNNLEEKDDIETSKDSST
ncbi:unnamed protein product [Cuscuta campestris]|uniref:TF-B3 domain-containing protein n=1 Tax=Cuscuta campestris TaxID=132261 RepID=A0A484ND09_9ASTE|nr:unnamed protein product [Cuscuta campestris]